MVSECWSGWNLSIVDVNAKGMITHSIGVLDGSISSIYQE